MIKQRRLGASILATFAAIAIWFLADDAAHAKVIEQVAAVVNTQIILMSEVDERLVPMRAQLENVPDPAERERQRTRLRHEALNQLIDENLIAQQARSLGIEVTNDEIDRATKEVMERNSLTPEKLEEALKQEGKTIEAYKREILRPQLLRLKVLNIQVRSRVNVSENEIHALYQKSLHELGVETQVRARHIFVLVPDHAPPSMVTKREKDTLDLLQQIQAGKDFAELAKEYSADPVTKEKGGDLGFFGRGKLPPEIEDTVFELKKGEVRGPLRSAHGFHIFQLTDRREAAAKSYAEVHEELQRQLYGEKMEKSTRAWIKELRKKSFIDTRI